MHSISAEKVALDFINVYRKYKERKFSKREGEGSVQSSNTRQSSNIRKRRKNTTDQEEQHTS
jgi:hypothetical protein